MLCSLIALLVLPHVIRLLVSSKALSKGELSAKCDVNVEKKATEARSKTKSSSGPPQASAGPAFAFLQDQAVVAVAP